MEALWIHIWEHSGSIYGSIVDTYIEVLWIHIWNLRKHLVLYEREFRAELKDKVDDIHLKPPKNSEIALEPPRTPLFTYSKLNYSTSAGLNLFAYSYVKLPCICDMTLLQVRDMTLFQVRDTSHMSLKLNYSSSAGLNLANHGKREFVAFQG